MKTNKQQCILKNIYIYNVSNANTKQNSCIDVNNNNTNSYQQSLSHNKKNNSKHLILFNTKFNTLSNNITANNNALNIENKTSFKKQKCFYEGISKFNSNNNSNQSKPNVSKQVTIININDNNKGNITLNVNEHQPKTNTTNYTDGNGCNNDNNILYSGYYGNCRYDKSNYSMANDKTKNNNNNNNIVYRRKSSNGSMATISEESVFQSFQSKELLNKVTQQYDSTWSYTLSEDDDDISSILQNNKNNHNENVINTKKQNNVNINNEAFKLFQDEISKKLHFFK